jgi:multidrug efflux pump subunit AcrA (membrane-fusion protein)
MRPSPRRLLALLVLSLISLGGCTPDQPSIVDTVATGDQNWAAVAHGKIDIEGGLLQLSMPRDGRVAEVLVHEGERVAEGQIMASLDPAVARLGVEAAKAKLDQAGSRVGAIGAQIKRLQQHAERLADAAAAGAGEEQTAEDAAAAVEQAKGELAIARAEQALASESLAAARLELDHQDLRAPVAGEVVRRSIQQGTFVSGQAQTAFILLPDQARIVRAEINESFIGAVEVGMRAEAVDESDSRRFALHVVRVGKVFGVNTLEDDPQLRASARSVECVLAFDGPEPENLLIGQRLTVRIAANRKQSD